MANDTRVIPAQLTGQRGEARIGITLDRPLADGTWHALARNARRLHVGDRLDFDGFSAEVRARDPDGGVALAFSVQGEDFAEALRRAGALALPPYIARPHGPLPEDARDYQTIFAEHEGAVAAPTAGLHFTPALLAALDARGVARDHAHAACGRRHLPAAARRRRLEAHRLHAERGRISAEAARGDQRGAARRGRRHDELRLLESAADAKGRSDRSTARPTSSSSPATCSAPPTCC